MGVRSCNDWLAIEFWLRAVRKGSWTWEVQRRAKSIKSPLSERGKGCSSILFKRTMAYPRYHHHRDYDVDTFVSPPPHVAPNFVNPTHSYEYRICQLHQLHLVLKGWRHPSAPVGCSLFLPVIPKPRPSLWGWFRSLFASRAVSVSRANSVIGECESHFKFSGNPLSVPFQESPPFKIQGEARFKKNLGSPPITIHEPGRRELPRLCTRTTKELPPLFAIQELQPFTYPSPAR